MNSFLRSLFLLLIFASTGVWADGVPLITAGPPLAKNDPVHTMWQRQEGFQKVHSVIFNQNAFGSNVLLVDIDGKQRRFVGSMKPSDPASTKGRFQVWTGTDGKDYLNGYGAQLSLLKASNGVVSGTVSTLRRTYEILPLGGPGRALLLESDPTVHGVTPSISPSINHTEEPK